MGEAVGWMRALVVDADDYRGLAEFWRSLLGVEIAEEVEEWVQLTPDPGGVYLAFQPAPAPQKPVGLRVRPDIEVADIDAAKSRIIELGGQEVRLVHEPDGDTHVIMADPEGNEFCILPPLPPELARTRWGDAGA